MNISFLRETPKVLIRQEIKTKVDALIAMCTQEVSWIGLVKRDGYTFTIEDIYLPSQAVNGGTTEIDKTEYGRLDEELRTAGILDYDKQDTVGLYMWGHSHHNMGVTPSGQDNDQVKEFIKSNPPYFIRIIANKRGEQKVDLYLNDEGIKIEDLVVTALIENSEWLESLRAEVAQKVRPLHLPSTRSTSKGTGGKKGASIYDHTDYWDSRKGSSPRAQGFIDPPIRDTFADDLGGNLFDSLTDPWEQAFRKSIDADVPPRRHAKLPPALSIGGNSHRRMKA